MKLHILRLQENDEVIKLEGSDGVATKRVNGDASKGHCSAVGCETSQPPY